MESEQPLRILAVVNLPWDRKLGASRVWLELAEQWRAAGHTVDKYCLTDAFPIPSTLSAVSLVRQIHFAYRAARYIRKNATRYDVIDSLLGTLPFSKKRLRFSGLLVARSVGFYRLYEKFDVLTQSRWPDLSWGRLFHRLVKRRAHQAAEQSVRHADLLNLANEDELSSLRDEVKSIKPTLVLPYGLTPQRRQALRDAALSAATRLAKKKICFIGMWSIRKGTKDWADIIRLIRAQVPDATFLFLGTLTDDAKVWEELDLPGARDFVELVSQYEPEGLPDLLRDSTVGVFPSYVEGFGLGVLEQLAAGIPIVAYDVPGPRQILRSIASTALAPVGDKASLAAQAISLLHADLQSYTRLREECLAISERYSWPEIADETIRVYRQALAKRFGGAIAFTHPFGLQSPTGGSRIMRALLQNAPDRFVSICTASDAPPQTTLGQEIHLPLRPYFGRIERTRFAGCVDALASLFAGRFTRRLEEVCRECGATSIHSIAHGGMDFYSAFLVAKKLGIPFFLQVHDDFIFSARGIRSEAAAHDALRQAWQNADARFVICRPLGEEYCRRYGNQDYMVITDGVDRIADAPRRRAGQDLQIYFMGLFHLDYEPNLKVLLAAVAELQGEGTGKLSVVLRCGGVRPPLIKSYENFVRILPFASEAEVQSDMERADLLYLPLPFGKKYELFVRYSLSTKMVTYVASGIPILYHGPPDAAVHNLLKAHDAALLCTEPTPDVLAEMLRVYINNKQMGTDSARNALELARRSFNLSEIREKFWGAIDRSLER
ncbi:MAG: glycosyltransferase family 4 protein [Chthoniobacterales bacterium]